VPNVDNLVNQISVEITKSKTNGLCSLTNGCVPKSSPPSQTRCTSCPFPVEFFRNTLAIYSADRSPRSSQALVLDGSHVTTPSVIMGRMLYDMSMPLPVPHETADHLKRWRLGRIVCGHTPHGNALTVFTSNGVQVLPRDNGSGRQMCCFATFAAAWRVLSILVAHNSQKMLSQRGQQRL
jgi:hypothetical protein